MNRLFVIGVASVVVASLAGCGGSGSGLVNIPNPRVRVANVMTGISTLQARIGTDVISTDVDFGTVTEYQVTENGDKDLTVGDTTFDNLATLDDTLYEENERYTGIAWGTATRAIYKLEEDKSTSGSGTVAIRFVHLSQGAANVDAYISGTADPLPGGASATNLAVEGLSDYSIVPVQGTNQYRIRVFANATTTNALIDQNITLDARDRATIVIYPDAGQASGFNALVLEENI